jgi:hypothetical protein
MEKTFVWSGQLVISVTLRGLVSAVVCGGYLWFTKKKKNFISSQCETEFSLEKNGPLVDSLLLFEDGGCLLNLI